MLQVVRDKKLSINCGSIKLAWTYKTFRAKRSLLWSCADVIHRNSNLVISCSYFIQDAKQIVKNACAETIVLCKCVTSSLPLPSSLRKIPYYYINTSEIPSELSHKNFISSHVKITCYLHTWRDHRRYGYIINRTFESKLTWYFTGVYIINRKLHTRLWIWILSSRVQLDIELTTRR